MCLVNKFQSSLGLRLTAMFIAVALISIVIVGLLSCLQKLGVQSYVDGLYPDNDYRREQRALEETMSTLVIPGIDAAKRAWYLLESLPVLWDQANLGERRGLLLTMLEAVYVDTVEGKAIVAIQPKPMFHPLFEIATTREDSDVVLINEPPQTDREPEAADLCCWWRRGRDELQQPVSLEAALLGWKAVPTICLIAES